MTIDLFYDIIKQNQYDVSGGDAVPYGSGTAYLPEVEICEHSCLDDATDEEIDEWNKNHVFPNIVCNYWKGRTERN